LHEGAQGGDPLDALVVDGLPAAGEDEHLEPAQLGVGGDLALEADVGFPLFFARDHQLTHEERLVDVLPVVCVVLQDHGELRNPRGREWV